MIAWLKGMVLYVAHGYKWSREIADFVRWSQQYNLWCKMLFFGQQLEKELREEVEIQRQSGPQNLLELLQDEFTKEQYRQMRQSQGKTGDGDSTLRSWVSREDLIRHIIHTPNLKAIVMRTFGSGNAPQSPWLLNALREGTRNGKVIVNISQCLQGAVEMSRYDCGYHLQEAGVISGRDMTVESAVTKLMFLQSHYPDSPDTVRSLMTQSLRGEISI